MKLGKRKEHMKLFQGLEIVSTKRHKEIQHTGSIMICNK
jgi:hypothetical protein